MSEPLVVCVPNFSEGRDGRTIRAILAALRAPGVRLLHHQADAEHHRLDTTVVGSPDAVRAAVLAAARVAVERIDMDDHRGGHPRMGALDVVPFVPLRDVTMDDAVAIARAFAEELSATLDLPVYCYDRAAFTDERRSLAEVRRGEYEGLRDAVAHGERLPDLGPHAIGRAGATAVGARKPLVAFNLYLSGQDEEAAKRIARAVRESNGGLPAVRAIGFAVPERRCITVSMNLVDHDVTPPAVAFAAVADLAAAEGLEVLGSEIVGLVPEAALTGTDPASLRLEGFDPDRQILERAVEAPTTSEATVGGFLAALASDAPTPGGGAAAAVAAATGAALLEMVAALTVGRPEHAASADRIRAIAADAAIARGEFVEAADRDGAAFDRVMAAFRLPKGTDDEKATRSAAIQAAYLGAAAVPLEVAKLATDLLSQAATAIADGNRNAASDGLSAAELLAASARSAAANVSINARSLRDRERAAALDAEVTTLLARVEAASRAAREAFAATAAADA